MASDDVKIQISAPGADQAKTALTDVAAAERKVGDAADASAKKAAGAYDQAKAKLQAYERAAKKLAYTIERKGKATDAERRRLERLNRATDGYRRRLARVDQATSASVTTTNKLASSVKTMIGSYLGLQGVIRLVAFLRAEMDRVDETTRSAIESLRAVLALSALAGERQATQQAIMDMTVDSGGRTIEEVATSYYTLRGGTYGMDPKKQIGLMDEAVKLGKTDLKSPLDPIVNLFTTLASQYSDKSPRELSNLISYTNEAAKSSAGEMARYLPDVTTAAQTGGVPIAQALAMFSFATRKGGGVAKSGQSVKSALLGLLAPTPNVKKQLADYGYPAGGDLTARLAWLAANASKLPPELQAELGGREGLQAVSAIAQSPEEFVAEIEGAQGALAAPGSLVGDRLASMYQDSPSQRHLDQTKQSEEMLRQRDYSDEAMREQSLAAFNDLMLERILGRGIMYSLHSGVDRGIRSFTGRAHRQPGGTIMNAMQQMLGEGYAPADIMKTLGPSLDASDFTGGLAGVDDDDLVSHSRQQMQSAGHRPMQGDVYNGGTHYHVADGNDPAGRPLTPAGAE